MEKGRIEFLKSFHQPGWKTEQNCNVQIFFYYSQIANVKCRIEFKKSFHQPGWNTEQNDHVQIFFYLNLNCVFS